MNTYFAGNTERFMQRTYCESNTLRKTVKQICSQSVLHPKPFMGDAYVSYHEYYENDYTYLILSTVNLRFGFRKKGYYSKNEYELTWVKAPNYSDETFVNWEEFFNRHGEHYLGLPQSILLQVGIQRAYKRVFKGVYFLYGAATHLYSLR